MNACMQAYMHVRGPAYAARRLYVCSQIFYKKCVYAGVYVRTDRQKYLRNTMLLKQNSLDGQILGRIRGGRE